jgi:hypothetical protein
LHNWTPRGVRGPRGVLVRTTPADAGHGHPLLVFDGRDRLDLPLTSFAKLASRQLAASSVRVYLYALLPFFAVLDGTRPAAELVERLLAAEQACADMENRWLKTADDLLTWIMLVDRLLAGKIVP